VFPAEGIEIVGLVSGAAHMRPKLYQVAVGAAGEAVILVFLVVVAERGVAVVVEGAQAGQLVPAGQVLLGFAHLAHR
jgi:hypothetical protein